MNKTMNVAFPVVKPAFAKDNIPVVISTDENYLPYVHVVVNSIKANSKVGNLDILILHDGLPAEKTANTLKRYIGGERISVRFVNVNAQKNDSALSRFRKTGRLPVSALYRLLVPSIMSEYAKAIYLDVDTVVCRDVADLYASDLGNCLFASALDIVQIINPEYIAWAKRYGFTEWDRYINSGVMVMNLERLRNESVANKLLPVAIDAARWACDQDAFNFVCKGRIKFLDPRWNVQVGDYCIAKQLSITQDGGWIYHFTETPKPWNRPEHRFAHYWWANEDVDCGVELWRKIYGSEDDRVVGKGIAVSVIIPIYNAAAYLPLMLISLAAQTLRNSEIICVDAGSDDGSFEICRRFASYDNRFLFFSQTNPSVAAARNRGIVEAKGDWLFFANPEDFCKPEMLAEMVAVCEKQNHDIILAGCNRIDCAHQGFLRIENVPKSFLNHKGKINCHTEGLNIFSEPTSLVLWNKLFKAEFVRGGKLVFHDIPSCEDMYFVFASLLAADSISYVEKSYYFYRTTLSNCQTNCVDKDSMNFLGALHEVKTLFEDMDLRLQEQFCCAAIGICFNNCYNRRTSKGRREVFELLLNDGIKSILFPNVDMEAVDVGKLKRPYELMMSEADVVAVMTEYYKVIIDSFLSLCGESQKRLRRLDLICDSLSQTINELSMENETKVTQIEELKTISSSMSFQVNRLRSIFMELARVGE